VSVVFTDAKVSAHIKGGKIYSSADSNDEGVNFEIPSNAFIINFSEGDRTDFTQNAKLTIFGKITGDGDANTSNPTESNITFSDIRYTLDIV
jgi:hypothetical protein